MELQTIVIVGGGLVGQTLAARLSTAGHDVTVIEAQADQVKELSATLDVRVIHGNGATPSVLRGAGAAEASLVIASTQSDEANLIVGLLAAQVFHVPRIVVRIHDEGHEETFAAIGGSKMIESVIVNPDAAAVDRIATLLEVPGAVDVVPFMDGELLVAGFRLDENSDITGLCVSDMRLLFAATPTLAVAIHRELDWVVPDGREEIRVGDLVYFAIARPDLDDVVNLVGQTSDSGNRVMVAGAGSIGMALARRLQGDGASVALIESDEETARRASELLDDVLVIHGRATDQSLLEEEEIEMVSTFVAATPDHENNLVSGLLAKRLGADRAFVLVDNPSLVALVGDVGIDAIISPRSLTIGLTLQHLRGGSVRSGAALLEDRIEIIEADAIKGSPITKAPLKELGLPRGVLVAALRRAGSLVVPRGDDRVEAGDRVLLITTSDQAAEMLELIAEP